MYLPVDYQVLSCPVLMSKLSFVYVAFIGDRMSTKIFVGRLTDGTTNDELHSLFRKFGTVTEAVAMGNYGFVVSNKFCY